MRDFFENLKDKQPVVKALFVLAIVVAVISFETLIQTIGVCGLISLLVFVTSGTYIGMFIYSNKDRFFD